MKKIWVFIGIVGLIGLTLGIFLVLFQNDSAQQTYLAPSTSPQTPAIQSSTPQKKQETITPASTLHIFAQDIPGVHQNFQFAADIPAHWQTEAVPLAQAIALFDPRASGNSNLEKSQRFIRFFSADQFLTLPTVTIFDQKTLQYNGKPAVRYDIAKKDLVPNFPGQPSWRNARHIVTDIRVSPSNPSIFYVIAKNPVLDEKIYEDFLQSLQVTDSKRSSIQEPIADFQQRITKKPFGIFISSKNSPVQPERFNGYHTGVDIEYGDVTGDIIVSAILDGTVVLSKQATGYGGVIAIEHSINGKRVIAIYGHLDPKSLPAVGASVKIGQQIGILGDGETPETDGERKHLHFGLSTSAGVDIRGYVQQKEELSGWLSPVKALNFK